MDEIVRAALRKWPQVPHCHGWLALDARGDWFMRDDAAQAAGPFPRIKGSRIQHDRLREFIHRNYTHDEHGSWYFQNGPQRVYVDLEAAPLILGVTPDAGRWRVDAHTGWLDLAVQQAWLDEHGRLFLATPAGLGLVRSLDMDAAADAVLAGQWTPQPVEFAELPRRHGYRLHPAAQR